jgi:hypothetical protein
MDQFIGEPDIWNRGIGQKLLGDSSYLLSDGIDLLWIL